VYDGNGDVSMEDGPTEWGYYLVRDPATRRGHVVDSGVS
jgi:hypothetical protein